ncbi:MAG: SDR family oxidoreductase [bacterium]|nr:SDR family oxidoreductase [bacterium]
MALQLPERFSLEGKVALITGGAGLLGVEHARALLELGARVCITDVVEESLRCAVEDIDADESTIIRLVMDVTSEKSIATTKEQLEIHFGGVDILINNASLNPKVNVDGLMASSRVENFSVSQWDRELSVGLTGAFLCSKAFGKSMADRKGGVILNIASDLSVISPFQSLYRKNGVEEHEQPVKPVTYSVIKTGLIGLTRYFATYWAAKGVRVNALSPGGIFDGQPEDFVVRLSELIPMGRMAAKDEYRGAVQYLCSNASAYLTGQNIVMDGGRSIW